MTGHTTAYGRTVRRLVIPTATLLVAATGTAAAMGSGSHSAGTMGGGGWGLFGGSMGLWGLLWMGLLIAVPLVVAYSILTRGTDAGQNRSRREAERPLSLLRERYARGDIDEEEFRRRRNQLERTE
ncbi:SHOCT domain-containing protein [Salinibaculum salinum]|uniref:SHOCT domain-containing protein n=1 Tax=Salinibaculum salinum TaxID=3131996 RepID=UPI0030EF5277